MHGYPMHREDMDTGYEIKMTSETEAAIDAFTEEDTVTMATASEDGVPNEGEIEDINLDTEQDDLLTNEEMGEEHGAQEGPAPKDDDNKVTEKKGLLPEFFCKLCKSQSSSQNDFDQHMNGNKHKENLRRLKTGERLITGTLNKKTNKYRSNLQVIVDKTEDSCVGVEYVIEYQTEDREMEERYICELCDYKLRPKNVKTHILSFNHRIKYLKAKHPELHKQVQNDVIPKKADKVPVVKRLCKEVEEKLGRKRVTVKVKLDPYFDKRLQHKRGATVPMGPLAKFPRMDVGGGGGGSLGFHGAPPMPGPEMIRPFNPQELKVTDHMEAILNYLEHDGLYTEYEARLAHQLSTTLSDAVLNMKLSGLDTGMSSDPRGDMRGRGPMPSRPMRGTGLGMPLGGHGRMSGPDMGSSGGRMPGGIRPSRLSQSGSVGSSQFLDQHGGMGMGGRQGGGFGGHGMVSTQDRNNMMDRFGSRSPGRSMQGGHRQSRGKSGYAMRN